jgi:PKD repeat protein
VPNEPPRAEFQVQCLELECVFLDRSADEDGSVVSWRWEFGDGAGSSERNPSHTYDEPGRYEVLLVVTDDDGAAASKTHRAEPRGPEPDRPPRADFEVRCEGGLTCTFEDRSKDDDGTIVSWQWSFGDGASSDERNPVHTYAAPGRYDVLLTVTDDAGGSNTKSRHADPKD